MRLFAHSYKIGKWNQLGNDLVGVASCDYFEYLVSVSSSVIPVTVGSRFNSDDGFQSVHARVLACSSTTKS